MEKDRLERGFYFFPEVPSSTRGLLLLLLTAKIFAV